MRIVAGTARGRRLQGPSSPGTRPLSDRAREALGNILNAHWDGARVLDLFAGTGAVGVEALSRGAATVTFVERDADARGDIEANVALVDAADQVTVERGDALSFIARASGPFDIVFSGPPQWEGLGVEALAAIDRRAAQLLSPDAVVVTQLDPSEDTGDPDLEHLARADQRDYGRVRLLFHGAAADSVHGAGADPGI